MLMTRQKMNIPAGTSLIIGPPAIPMEESLSTAIGKLTESIEGILEAHLPQMFIIGVMEEPAQVLVIVRDDNADHAVIAEQLGLGLKQILPRGMHLDVWPISVGHAMLKSVRETGCKI